MDYTLLASLSPLLEGWGGDEDAREDIRGGRSILPSPHPLSSGALQCLKPEDVAEAVIYVLSTPPHVQVSLALTAHPLEEASHPQRRTAGRP